MDKEAYNVHISLLQVIENQLARLHHALACGSGDDDVTQEQITQLQTELCRLSKQLGDAEVKT